MKTSYILTILLSSLIVFVQAQTWDGSQSTDWNDAANWTPATVPTTGSNVTINTAAGNQPVLDQTRTIDELTMSNGTLDLNNFTLTVADKMDLTGGTIQDGSMIVADIDKMERMTFNGTITITKNAGGDADVEGGNVFNGPTTFNLTHSSKLKMAKSMADTFNSTATFVKTGTGDIELAREGDNIFADDLTIDCNATGKFKIGTNNATVNQTAGAILSNGFTLAELTIENYIQSESANHDFLNPLLYDVKTSTFLGNTSVTTTTGDLKIDASTYAGNNDFTANDRLTITGANNFSTTSGITTLTKNGTGGNDNWDGDNTYGELVVINNSTGDIKMENAAGSDFNGDATFRQTSTGVLQVGRVGTNTFAGDISTVGTTTRIVFGAGGGTTEIDGNTAQFFRGSNTYEPVVNNLLMNTSGSLTLEVNVAIASSATFTNGILNSTSTDLLKFRDNSSVSGASASSHVDGPVRKIGNDAFTFPTGDGTAYASIAISGPSNNTDHFTAEYFPENPNPTYDRSSKDLSINNVSKIEYWILDRTNGTSAVSVTLSWRPTSLIGNKNNLVVARWNGSSWIDHGNGGTTGNGDFGTVVSAASINSFSPFTLSSTSDADNLPIELAEFNAFLDSDNDVQINWVTATELNNDFFTLERSLDAINWTPIKEIEGAGTSFQTLSYNYTDANPAKGRLYYRLKQTDFDGTFTYSNIASVYLPEDISSGLDVLDINVYPNPANNTIHIDHGLDASENTLISQIFDLSGKLVQYQINSIKSGGLELDLNDLESGTYLIKVSIGEKSEILRVIKK